eukprot:ANDGO_00080.mRNA.2 hypothetical protein GUITHDRAFT_107171
MAFLYTPAGYENLNEDEVMQLPFDIEKSELAFKNYAQVTKKWVKYPSGKTFQFDTVSKNASYVQMFAYHSDTKMVTVICEYAFGVGKMQWTLPGGGFDKKKHANLVDCVQAELSEEVRLRQPNLEKIIPLTSCGLAFVCFDVISNTRLR